MVLNWQKEIPFDRPWAPCIAGCFYQNKHQVLLFYKGNFQVYALAHDEKQPAVHVVRCESFGETEEPTDGKRLLKAQLESRYLLLPEKWRVFRDHTPPYLLLSSELGMDLSSMKLSYQLPTQAIDYWKTQHKMNERTDVLFETNEYCIRSCGEHGCTCERNGQILWKFKGRGYINTRILYHHNRIVFGTAGNGGYLYVLSINTGEKITAIKTGGTSSFVQQQNLCYFLANTPSAKLICLNILTGHITAEVPLGGKNFESPIELIGNQLHTITFHFKSRQLYKAVWHCIALNESSIKHT